MNMVRALLVDDSPGSLRTLRNLLKRYCPGVEIIGEATSVSEAHNLILTLEPNLLFLDIEMPEGSGFELLEKVREYSFEVIFVTAYDHYALEAIRVSALDYTLKPVGYQRLQEAVQKVEERLKLQERPAFHRLLEQLSQSRETSKLPLPLSNGFIFIPTAEIMYCLADGIYSRVFIRDKKEHLTTRRLIELEESLQTSGFFRIHRSSLINLNYVKRYIRGDGGSVIMEDGHELTVSRAKRDSLLKSLNIL